MNLSVFFLNPTVFSQLCGQEGYFDCFLAMLIVGKMLAIP